MSYHADSSKKGRAREEWRECVREKERERMEGEGKGK